MKKITVLATIILILAAALPVEAKVMQVTPNEIVVTNENSDPNLATIRLENPTNKEFKLTQVDFYITAQKGSSVYSMGTLVMYRDGLTTGWITSDEVINSKTRRVTLTVSNNQSLPAKTTTSLEIKAFGVYGTGEFLSATRVHVQKPEGATLQFYSKGPKIIVKEIGILKIDYLPFSPNNGLMSSQTEERTLISYLSTNKTAYISSLPIYIGKLNDGGPDQIQEVRVYYNNQLVGSKVAATTDDTPGEIVPIWPSSPQLELDQEIKVSSGTYNFLEIRVITSEVNELIGSSGQSGQGFFIEIPGEEIQAVDEEGLDIKSVGFVSSNDFILVRAKPFVATNSESQGRVNEWRLFFGMEQAKPLYSIQIFPRNYGIGLKRLSFRLLSRNTTIENMGIRLGRQEVPTQVSIVSNGDFDYVTIDFNDVVEIDPYSENVLTFVGDVLTTQNQNCFLLVHFLGDSDFPSPLPGSFEEVQQNNFIWTDFNANPVWRSADPEVLNHYQWFNGFEVDLVSGSKMLPVNSDHKFFTID